MSDTKTRRGKRKADADLGQALAASVPQSTATTELPLKRCINCGARGGVIRDGDVYRCTICKHTWGDNHEQAPFRRVQRGNK